MAVTTEASSGYAEQFFRPYTRRTIETGVGRKLLRRRQRRSLAPWAR